MKILDLYCGAGGASMGYRQAFPQAEIIGVDIAYQKRYPFKFIQGDALTVGRDLLMNEQFDFVHASPPCQKYSDLAKQAGGDYPDLIPATRQMLKDSGLPYVIENVDTAPLDGIMLCGAMFPGLRVYRHRLFETSFKVEQPVHPKHTALVYTHDRRKYHYGKPLTDDMFVQVTGGGNAPVKMKGIAMQIDWMINKELNEAIPPAYTKWIAEQWKLKS